MVNGKSIKEGEYTQGPITVKIATKNVDATGYRLQYTIGNPEVTSNWKDYDNRTGVEFTTKGNLYVRLSDGRQGGTYTTTQINNIDTLPPKQFTPNITTGIDYITVTGSTVDQEETATSASSGIARYYFSKDNGTNWEPKDGTTNTSYTFDNLESGTNYKIKMKAIDKVGKEIITEPIERATEDIEIAYQYSPSTWTNGNVAVTIATTPSLPEGYMVEYSKDRTTWDSNNTMSQKGELYIRIKNANNHVIKDNMTANVLKIDTEKPKDFTITEKRATTSTIEVEVKAEDAEETATSGKSEIEGYRFAISKDGGKTWTEYPSANDEYQESGTYQFTDLIGDVAGVTYKIKVTAKDHAGNTKEVVTECSTIRNDTYYIQNKNTSLATIQGRKYHKFNDGSAIVTIAYFKQVSGTKDYIIPFLISTDESAVSYGTDYDEKELKSSGYIEYYGTKFYYSSQEYGFTSNNQTVTTQFTSMNGYEIETGGWQAAASNMAKDLLDRYFKDDWTGEVNSPKLTKGMTPVYWDESNNERILTSEHSESEWNNWYNYVAGDNTTDTKTSKWANAKMTKDGEDSYFVWVPRYEYKILSGEGTSTAGKIDVKFIPTSQTTPDEGYKIHPAFRNGTANNFKNGEWDRELSGIWVGKYETSRSDATDSSAGNSENIKIVPGVQSWRDKSVGESYEIAYNYDRKKESHLIKNSEWGAVAYLTHSQYGRNGHEIDINDSQTFITGNGGGSPNATANSGGITYAHNTTLGAQASSTGNMYGIFDLSGGGWERVAVYITNGNASLSNGSSFVATTTSDAEAYKTLSTKYVTVYPFDSPTSDYNSNYTIYKNAGYGYGDAILETAASGGGYTGWFEDSSFYFSGIGVFMLRGGTYSLAKGSGIFGSTTTAGATGDSFAFRITLAGM